MAKNKIITSQGNVQFINSKGKVINMHPMHCYAVYENDTVSFLFIYMKEYSGQAFFASQFEDLEVNGESYDNIEDLKDAITEAFAKAGAQARTEIVDELPETGFTNTIYLVPKEHGSGYDEYVYTEEGEWELIGDTDIEFDRYLEKTVFYEYSAATEEKIDYISGAVDTNASDIEYISGAVDTEISAREAADAFISGAVDTVSADLASEVSRALSAETALGNRIDTVNSRVDAEQLARVQADTALSGAIETEISDRESADTALQNAIDAEASARTDADTVLEGKIDAVSGAVDTEVARATSAETLLNTAINTETSARRNADDAILGKVDVVSGAVDTEVARAEAAEAELQDAIDAEVSARTDADTALDGKIDAVSASVETMGDEAIVDAAYVSSSTTIDFYNASGDVVAQVDATDFIKDGMIEDVRIENGYLIIDFNTASGIEDIQIPLTDIFDPDNYYDKTAVDGFISDLEAADSVISGAVDNVSADLATEAQRAQDAEDALSGAIDTKLAISDFNTYSGAVETALGNKVNVSDFETYSGAVETELGNKFDSSAITAYSTSSEVTAEIEAAVSGKVDTTDFEAFSGNVETELNNKQSTLTAGRGIDITNDEISLDFPISAGTGADSLLMSGSGNTASGKYSVAFGKLNTVSGECGVIMGNRNTSNNFAETAFGQKNVSRTEAASSFGSSGNTIFTVGNGIINVEQGVDANHNAFEIRGNGDIYIADTNAAGSYYEKPMIKLQDALSGNGISSGEVQTMIDNSISGKVDTSAFTAYSASVETALGLKADLSALTEDERVWGEALNDLNTRINTVSGDVASKASQSAVDALNGVVTAHTANTTVHVTSADKTNWNGKANSADVYNKTQVYTKAEVDEAIAEIDLSEIENRLTEDEEVTSAGLNALNDKFGGLKLMKISQTDYDNLQVKDNNTLYIISD